MKIYTGNWSPHRPFYDFFEKIGISNELNHKIHDVLKYLKLIERQRINIIKVDRWDTWNADDTLATIIAAVMIKFKEEGINGYPPSFDVKDANGLDEIEGWTYIIDEIIYVFSNYALMWEHDDDYVTNKARFDNGARLFAKYFTHLWD